MANIKFLKPILIAVSCALTITSCKPKEQNPCGFVQNVYGQRISWKTHEPIELVITNDIPAELRPAIYRAAKTWENQTGQKLFNITEDASRAGANPSKDGKNGIYFLSSWEADRRSEQGRTSVYWAADQIMEADIRINAQDFSFYADQNHAPLVLSSTAQAQQVNAMGTTAGYSFEALVLHELGHFLGLKHTADAGSVMVTHLSDNDDRTTLSASDAASIQCVYK